MECRKYPILITKTTAAQNEVVLCYHRVRGLYFPTVIFVTTTIRYATSDQRVEVTKVQYVAEVLSMKLIMVSVSPHDSGDVTLNVTTSQGAHYTSTVNILYTGTSNFWLYWSKNIVLV